MPNTKKWGLNSSEIGKVTGDNHPNGSVNVYIPKVLPLVDFNNPEEKPIGLDAGCFCNADGCKLSLASSVTSKNHITVPLSTSEKDLADFKTKSAAVGVPVQPTAYTHGAEVRVDVKAGSVEQMTIAGLRDTSMRY